jgi:hypothetical protein
MALTAAGSRVGRTTRTARGSRTRSRRKGRVGSAPDSLDAAGRFENNYKSDQPDECHQQAVLGQILAVISAKKLPDYPEHGIYLEPRTKFKA